MHDDVPAALPLFAYAAALTLGVAAVRPLASAFSLLVAAALLFALRRRAVAKSRFAIALIAFAFGLAVAAQRLDAARGEQRAFRLVDSDRFVVVTAPLDHDWAERGGTSLLRLAQFDANGSRFDSPLLLYARFDPPDFGYAASIRAEGFLRRNERGVYTLTVKSPRLVSYFGSLSPFSPRLWNRALARRLKPLADTDPVEVGLVNALVLGRNERLDDDVRDSFRRGGTYHLLVFSGLQIALAAAALAWVLRWLRAPRASDWLLLAFAIVAPLFIGGTASVSRASVAIGLYAASRIAGRPTSIENLWCVAAIARLIVAPADLGDPAFHLTYAGAGAILFVARKRPLLMPIAAELAVLPLTLFHFHQYALGGSLMTLLMTPLVFAMLVVSAFVFAFPSAIHAITLLHSICRLLNDAGAVTSGFWRAPPTAALVAGYGGSLAALAFVGRRWRPAVIAACLAIPAAAVVLPHGEGPESVTALDVGQGDSILLRNGRTAVLVDGGGRSDAPRFGETVLLPLLADEGIHHLDAVVLTHAHPDHCGGLPAVLRNLAVAAIWINPHRFRGECAASVLEAATESRTPIHLVHDGDRLVLAGLHATALLAGGSFRRSAENNSSTVLRVQLERRRILLTGDIERDAEGRLGGRRLACDVLKVAHHGSRTSSTAAFLSEVRPRIALISAGRRNVFGHPNAEVLDALRARGVEVLRTDRSGSLSVELRNGVLYVRRQIDTPN